MMDHTEACLMIADRCPELLGEATACIKAHTVGSPVAGHRLQRLATRAIQREGITPEELAEILKLVELPAEPRDRHIQIRVSGTEYQQIKALAGAAGLEMSSYLRQRALARQE